MNTIDKQLLLVVNKINTLAKIHQKKEIE